MGVYSVIARAQTIMASAQMIMASAQPLPLCILSVYTVHTFLK